MGVLEDATLDEDFKAMKEEEPALSPAPDKEVVPPPEKVAPPTIPEPDLEERVKKDPDHWVPLPTFLEEKKERQRLEKLQQELSEKQARLDERHKVLFERMQPAAPPPPDPSTDPLGYLQHQDQQQQQRIQEFQQKIEAFERQRTEEAQFSQLRTHVGNAETEFAKKQADYWDAISFVKDMRMKQYALAGLNDADQIAALSNDTRNWTIALVRAGKDPAEATYELAKTYGYANSGVRAESNGASQPAARNADGTFAKAPESPKVAAAKQALKTVERGQAANKSIGDAPGGAPKTGIPSPDELASMSDEEFDQLTDVRSKKWKAYWMNQ